jgi:hypothetical protein
MYPFSDTLLSSTSNNASPVYAYLNENVLGYQQMYMYTCISIYLNVNMCMMYRKICVNIPTWINPVDDENGFTPDIRHPI